MMAYGCRAKTMLINEGMKDLISYLPCNVIDCIMDQLPLHDTARMAVVSRKWRDVWKSLVHLKFDDQFFEKLLNQYPIEDSRFYLIVSKVLLCHNGSIHQFFLHIPDMISESPEIGPFMNFLSTNGVREITIENYWSSSLNLPSDLFSCVELKSLKLDYCTLNIPPTFETFRKLSRLELANVRFKGDAFRSFISSCPMLENLILNGLSGVDHPTIDAPNLKHLEVLGTFKSLALRSCHSLLSIEIGLLEKVLNGHDNRACGLLDFLSSSCKLQELNIKGNFFQFMAAPCCWEMHNRTFKELRLLRLSNINANSIFQFFFACSLIQSCPNMEELTISFKSNTCSIEYKVDCDAGYKLNSLRKLCIYSVNGVTAELNLIKFLLSSSPVLEKVYVKSNPKIKSHLGWKLTRALMRFPRASAKAEIVYMDNWFATRD